MKVSVVIPTYNREKTIRRCLDSILCQSHPVFEIIVVDDGSTDTTPEIIEREYAEKVRIIRQNHRGAQAARNLGILNAVGDYVAFLDSDDEWLPDKLEVQIGALRGNENAVVYGDHYVQTDWKDQAPQMYQTVHRKFKGGRRKISRVNGRSGYVYDELLKNSQCMFQGLLTSRGNLIEIGLLDEKVPSFQEWDTAIRLARKYEFIYIKKPLFVYHLHDGETISKSTEKYIDGLEYIYGKFEKEVEERLGYKEVALRYKSLMTKCIEYRDARLFKYFFKYLTSIMNMYAKVNREDFYGLHTGKRAVAKRQRKEVFMRVHRHGLDFIRRAVREGI